VKLTYYLESQLVIAMGNLMGTDESTPLAATAIPSPSTGKRLICIAGFASCPHYKRALAIAEALVKEHPEKYEQWNFGPTKDIYQQNWLPEFRKSLDAQWQAHTSSPICWIEEEGKPRIVIGGRDKFTEWVKEHEASSNAAGVAGSFHAFMPDTWAS